MTTHLNRYLTLWAVVVLLPGLSRPSQAHNGRVAVAYPVESITIDADLSDWPEELAKYPIRLLDSGEPPQDEADFQGFFRVGYNTVENALYIAMEIQDDSIVLDPSDEKDQYVIYAWCMRMSHMRRGIPCPPSIIH